MKTQKAVSTVSTPAKKQAVALKDLKTKKNPIGGASVLTPLAGTVKVKLKSLASIL
jgi:hypothetical protein